MPPRSKLARGLVGLAGTDSEPDLDDFAQAPTSHRSPQPAKRPRGRPPAAHKVTKPVSRQSNSRNPKSVSQVQTSPRRALSDRSNLARPQEANIGDDLIAAPASPAPNDDVPLPTKQSKLGRGRPPKARPGTNELSPPMKSDQEHIETAEDEMAAETQEKHAEPIADAMEVEQNSYRDVENDDNGLNDSSLRRKLGDLTRKYESLESRHRDLRDVGVAEAERNFEKLRKQADDNAAASTRLIEELRAELATQAAQLRQGEEVLQQLESSEARCKDLQSSLTKSKGALDEARAEIKTLTTKLTAFRSAEATGKAPGSVRKAGPGAHRAAPSDVVQAGQAKEDMYGDLTGLILRGVQLGESEDVFDCIQTGRNGTLHFKLALEKAEPADNYEDVQFTYRPQLDEDRDGDLMEVLPDYLVEEITFPRTHAAKFYARVIKSLTERLE